MVEEGMCVVVNAFSGYGRRYIPYILKYTMS